MHSVGFSSEVASALLGREAYVGGGIQRWREVGALWAGGDAHQEFVERSYRDAIDIGLLFGNDIIRPTFWRYNVKPTRKIDENTYLFEYGDEASWKVLRYDPPSEQCAITPYLPGREPTFEHLAAQLAADEQALADYRADEQAFDFELRALAELGDERAIRAPGVGVGVPHDQVWLEALILRPELVRRHLDVQTERAVRNLEFLAGRGLRYFFGGYDFAAQTGPMFSPEIFRELIVPPLRKVSDASGRLGVKHLFASDGNLWPVADVLFGVSGIDGYYEIDRRAGMDLARLREAFAELTLIGNISSHSLHLASRQEVVAEVRDCLETARRLGRIIVGVSNYIVPGTPIENVTAMLETVEAFHAGRS